MFSVVCFSDMKKFHVILYICGAAGLPIINCIGLATDIIYRSCESRRGKPFNLLFEQLR